MNTKRPPPSSFYHCMPFYSGMFCANIPLFKFITMNRTEYLAKIRHFIEAYKELQECKIGNIPPEEYAGNMSRLFNDLDHNWTMGIREIYHIWGYYTIHTDLPTATKQATWDNISNHLINLAALAGHSNFISEQQLCFEQLLTELEQEDCIFKEICIRSATEELAEVTNFLEKWISRWQIPELNFKIQQATAEAVNNAFLHGNKKDYTKKIEVTACKQENKVIITVKDEGSGFDYMNIPSTPPAVNREAGRGLFLIKELTDNLSFQDNGSKIILSFVVK